MKSYPIPMVPGPVKVPPAVLDALRFDYGSGDLESEFLELYNQTEASLQQILGTRNPVAIQTGEGMLALWGALKSCLRPGERLLALATGVFGYGIGDMARSTGADVRTVGFGYDETLHDWERIERAIAEFRPKMITVVHCENSFRHVESPRKARPPETQVRSSAAVCRRGCQPGRRPGAGR